MEVTRAIFVSLMLNNAFWCDRTHSRPQEGTISHSPLSGTMVGFTTRRADTLDTFGDLSTAGTSDLSPRFHEPVTPVRNQTRRADTLDSLSLEPPEKEADQLRVVATRKDFSTHDTGELSTLSPSSWWADSDLASSKLRTSTSKLSSDLIPDLRTQSVSRSIDGTSRDLSPSSSLPHPISMERSLQAPTDLDTQIARGQIGVATSGLASEPQALGHPWQTEHISHPTPMLIDFVKQYYMQGVPENARSEGMGQWLWNFNTSKPGEGETAILKFGTNYPLESGLIQEGESALILAVYDYRFKESHGKDLKQWRSWLTTSSRIIGFSRENQAMNPSVRNKPIEYRDVGKPLEGIHSKAYILLLNFPRRWVLAPPDITLVKAVKQVDVVATRSPQAWQFFQPFPKHTIAQIWEPAGKLLSSELGGAFRKGKPVRTESLPLDDTGIDNQVVTMAYEERYETFLVPLWALEPLAKSGGDDESIRALLAAP